MPPAAHREVVLEAVRVGARVLCEKPLATTQTDAELLEVARARRAQLRSASATGPSRRSRASASCSTRTSSHVLWTTGSQAPTRAHRVGRTTRSRAARCRHTACTRSTTRAGCLGEAEVEQATVAPDEDAFSAVLAHEHGRRTRLTVSLVADERVHRLEAGDLVLENRRRERPRRRVHAHGRRPCGRRSGRCRLRPEADPRVGPFAALALALLEDRERPTFTDGLQAQRLMDEVRRAAS